MKDAQQEEKHCYHCKQPRSFHQGLSVGEIIQKGIKFKLQRGEGTKEGSPDPSRKGDCWWHPRTGCQRCRTLQTPFLNPDPFQWWYGVKNVARVRDNGESCMALLDNGMQVNTIMPSFIQTLSLEVGPLSDLVSRQVACVGLGNEFTQPLGYVVIWVWVDGVQGYDKDQIALVIWVLLDFAVRVPVISGTLTTNHVINMIKEKEIDALGKCPSGPSPVSTKGCSHGGRWPNCWEFKLGWIWWNSPQKKYETIDAFLSWVLIAKAGTPHTSERINVTTQALCIEDGSLPQGLTVQNAYTKLRKGSKNVVMVVRNSTPIPRP